ncbi:Pre-mRNA-splicing factor 38, partial [Piptocephalis cylindrospora]
IIRGRIYDSAYWRGHCFALNAATLVEKAVRLKTIGGQYANTRPTNFLCLTLKLLQIQPEKDIIYEYIQDKRFKYLRALGALYLRLVGNPVECYTYLEPLLADYRKLRQQGPSGQLLTHMDEFVYSLLRDERVCDIILPRLPKRDTLEATGELDPRASLLDEELEEEEDDDDDDDDDDEEESDDEA